MATIVAALISGITILVATLWIRPVIAYRTLQTTINEILSIRRESNSKVQNFSRSVIRNIESDQNSLTDTTFATKDDIEKTKKLSSSFSEISKDSTENIKTIAYLFETIASNLENTGTTKTDNSIIFGLYKRELNLFILQSFALALKEASSYVPYPKRFKAIRKSPIKSHLSGLIEESKVTEIPGLSSQINLNPLGYPSILYYEQVIKRTPKRFPALRKEFFKALGDIKILLIEMLNLEIYIPTEIDLILDMPSFFKTKIHLISLHEEHFVNSQQDEYMVIKAIYGNLASLVSFKNILDNNFKEKALFSCRFANNFRSVDNFFDQVNTLNDECVELSVTKTVARECLDKSRRSEIETHLVLYSNRNWLYQKLRLLIVRNLWKFPKIASSLGAPYINYT